MPTRLVRAILLAAALTAAPLAAQAQAVEHHVEAPKAAPANPEAEALVRRYLAAIHFERTMDTLQGAMLPLLEEEMAKETPNLTAADRQMLGDIVRDEMRDKVMPRMIDRMAPIYAQTFTLPELKALVEFYESPVGRSITDKIASLAPRSAGIMRDLMPQMQKELAVEVLRQFCLKHSCAAQDAPKASPS